MKLALATLALLFAHSLYVPASGASVFTDGTSVVGSGIDTAEEQIADRRGRRRRVPGGSGCDDPEDIAEHPECTP
jgi:hypothetical protein